MTSSSPVGTARPFSILFLTMRMPVTAPVLAVAEDLHRRAQEAQLDAALVTVRLALAYSRSSSTLRLLVGSPSVSSQFALKASSSMSAGSTMMSARVSSPSSRSSGVVNAACAGPRRPSTITSWT